MKVAFLFSAFLSVFAGMSSPALAAACYSEVYADPGLNVTGISVTEVDYSDPWDDFIGQVYVSAVLYDSVDYLDSEEGSGDYLAEVDLNGSWTGSGMYYVYGEHSADIFYGEELFFDYPIGESEDSNYFAVCDFPEFETSYDGGWSATYGTFYRTFGVTVEGDISFEGRTGYELWAGGDMNETCSSSSYLPSLFGNYFTINAAQGYIDTIGLGYSEVLDSKGVPITPCGFHVYQGMWMTCSGGASYNYQTNDVVAEYGQTYMSWQRGDGSAYFPD